MAERVKIPPAPTVYCPKDKEKVPIWHCLGSLTQGRETCPYLVRATVHGAEWAEVECKWEEGERRKREQERQQALDAVVNEIKSETGS